MGSFYIYLSIMLPIICGAFVLIRPEFKRREELMKVSMASLCITGLFVLLAVFFAKEPLVLLKIHDSISIRFAIDGLGRLFAVVVSIVWIAAGFFSVEYMKHENEEKRYFGFYLCVYGVLMALCFSGNLVTYYFFYEMMTILSMPLVFHSRTREAITASIKYLLYSLFGAYMVLFALYFLNYYATTLDFIPGGSLNLTLALRHSRMVLIVSMMLILGFGVKAGMFPLHGWLPTAHPVAPAPASAVLSGLIVKMGALGIIRSIYYCIGMERIAGTWVQKTWIILALITVFLGSLMAYREKVLKKRLAYSTVSQASYILFGLALLQPEAMTGALLHVVFHAFIKSCLFLSAGAIIFKTKKTRVEELTGIGKEMPVAIWCYTFASLALIGIPPASGFISKWYLAVGSLHTGMPVIAWLGPVVLLVSALLTAGYLLPITINGFLPGNKFDYAGLVVKEPVKMMLIPLGILSGLALLLGVWPGPLTSYINGIIDALFIL